MWLLQVFLGQGIETFSLSTLLYTLLQPTMEQIILNSDPQQWHPQCQYK